MTLYIIAKIYYKDLIDKLDVIYNKPNLFSNAENHFLFIKSNTLQIFLPKFYELEISDKYLIPENYIFNISKSYNDAISLIMENLTKNKYDKIKFIIPSIYPYKLQIALFHYFFHIENSIIYYQNKFHELSNNEIIEMFDLNKGYNGTGRKLFFEEIEKEMKLKLLDKIVSNIFMQKSTYTQNINLPYLFFDNDLKKSLISNNIKKGVNEFNNDFYLYKVNKIQNQNIYFVENIYSFLDKFDDIYLDVNNSKYFDLDIGKIVLLEDETYYSKENFMTLDSVRDSNKKLCEFFKYYDYFSFEQMLYTIYELEEHVRTNLDDEIVEYSPISLDFDIIDFTNKLLKKYNN